VRFRLTDVELAPDVFAAVMATGIVSIAASKHHYTEIAQTLGVLATIGMLFLVALAGVSGAVRAWDVRDPDVTLRLFTFVAACAVLDNRLAAQRELIWVLGAAAAVAWLTLVVLAGRAMVADSWAGLRDRAHGVWELASVGTSGLAIVMTLVARHVPGRWLLAVAVLLWVAALCIYALMTWLILWRAAAERQDRDGFEPDSWILMGGLAIATLTGDDIGAMAPGWLAGPLRAVTIFTWVAATLWIPPLIYFGLNRISGRPDMLHFAGVWWALVFPLGMYSAASYAMSVEIGQRSLVTVSLVFFWDALAAWLIVVAAGLLRLRRWACGRSG
jgi:tellurite resistance protein TehA-like permease